MKKSIIFIIVLCVIILAEMWALYRHARHPSPVEYAFDVQEYDLPEPELKGIKPFLFENKWIDEVNNVLDEIQAEVESGYKNRFLRSLDDWEQRRRRNAQIKQEQSAGLEKMRRHAAQEKIAGEYLGRNRCAVDGVEGVCKDGIYKLDEYCVACYHGHCAGASCGDEENSVEKQGDEDTQSAEQHSELLFDAEPSKLETNDVVADKSGDFRERPFKSEGKAMVAVVIDDVGLSVPFTNQLLEIKKPVTVAFLPYGAADKSQVMKMKNAGFEVLLHAPMMPHVRASLAPNTLSPQMSHEDIQQGFKVMLERFADTGMVGANNHMGSLFTEDRAAMAAVIEVLKQNKMFFLDSKTSAKSVAKSVCREYEVPYIARDVFLDNERDYGKIMSQFAATERIAKKRGYAVAIGHPYKQTLQALKDWEKNLEAHDIELVPLLYLVRKIN